MEITLLAAFDGQLQTSVGHITVECLRLSQLEDASANVRAPLCESNTSLFHSCCRQAHHMNTDGATLLCIANALTKLNIAACANQEI